MKDDYNQYAITWGAKNLREALAARVKQYNGMDFDAEAEITVTCGSTEAMMASMLATIQPGDEVIVPEPFYENYGPDAQISGAVPRYVHLEDDFSIDEEAWKAAFSKKSRAIILNTPNNPTGKVFTRNELSFIADLCTDHNLVAITDEIYEHILYDGRKHVWIGSLEGMYDRTITIGSFSKTYSVTGWRVPGLRADGCPHDDNPLQSSAVMTRRRSRRFAVVAPQQPPRRSRHSILPDVRPASAPGAIRRLPIP